jgi:hypothetical protein
MPSGMHSPTLLRLTHAIQANRIALALRSLTVVQLTRARTRLRHRARARLRYRARTRGEGVDLRLPG